MKKCAYITIMLMLLMAFTNTMGQENVQKIREKEARAKTELLAKIRSMAAIQGADYDGYDVTYYHLEFEPDPTTKILYGKVLIRAKVVAKALKTVELDFSHPMVVDRVIENNVALTFQHQDHILRAELTRTYQQGDSFEVQVVYSGRPRITGFGSFNFDTYNNIPMIWTLSEPFGARDWWPCKDLPADKADSVDIKVTVPSNFIVASNGLLRELTQLEAGKKMYWWHESYPITTYLVSLAIYPYKTYSDWYKYSETDSMEIQFYVFPQNYNAVQENYAKTKDMIRVFSELFGAYPFLREKYGHAECLFGGGMEHQTITSLGGHSETLIVHELAHMWWGDMITCQDFHHIWLNEGFASYSEALWWEQRYGTAAFHQYIRGDEYRGPGTIYVEDTERDNIFDGNLSYRKASFVLHMLRHVVGDSNFFKILSTYYAAPEHQYGTATTEEFRAICEQVAGMNLERFFQQWIYEEGFPIYELGWGYTPEIDGTYTVQGFTRQVQTLGPIFWMPIDITIQMTSGEYTFVHNTDAELNTFSVNVPSLPTKLILDKDNWVLEDHSILTGADIQVGRSTVQEMTGNGNGTPEAGETASVAFAFFNAGVGVQNFQATLSTDDPDVVITRSTINYTTIGAGQSITSNANAFELSLENSFTPRVVKFRMAFSSTTPVYSASYELGVPIGHARILVVEDDGNREFSDNFALFDSAYILIQAVPQDSIAVNESSVDNYAIVIWDTGADDSETITAEDQEILTAFLDKGGKLALFGQNIGRDLVAKGSQSDRNFYENVLHARYESDNSGSSIIQGASEAVVGPLLIIPLRWDDNSPTQESPDVIAPGDGAQTILQYLPSKKSAAINYENGETRIAVFGFSLSALQGKAAEKGKELLQSLVNWLAGFASGTGNRPGFASIPKQYELRASYPNPFSTRANRSHVTSPGTTIEFTIPDNSLVDITLYNVLGQKVRRLVTARMEPGLHQVRWDGRDDLGRDPGNGVYIVMLRAGDFSASRKILKLN